MDVCMFSLAYRNRCVELVAGCSGAMYTGTARMPMMSRCRPRLFAACAAYFMIGVIVRRVSLRVMWRYQLLHMLRLGAWRLCAAAGYGPAQATVVMGRLRRVSTVWLKHHARSCMQHGGSSRPESRAAVPPAAAAPAAARPQAVLPLAHVRTEPPRHQLMAAIRSAAGQPSACASHSHTAISLQLRSGTGHCADQSTRSSCLRASMEHTPPRFKHRSAVVASPEWSSPLRDALAASLKQRRRRLTTTMEADEPASLCNENVVTTRTASCCHEPARATRPASHVTEAAGGEPAVPAGHAHPHLAASTASADWECSPVSCTPAASRVVPFMSDASPAVPSPVCSPARVHVNVSFRRRDAHTHGTRPRARAYGPESMSFDAALSPLSPLSPESAGV